MDEGNGSWPGFWLISHRHATNPNWRSPRAPKPTCRRRSTCSRATGTTHEVFTGTIHRNSCECYGEPNEINANNWQPRRVNLTRRFHTYAMRWTPTRVTWFLDQRRIMSWPVFDTTNTRMFLLFTMHRRTIITGRKHAERAAHQGQLGSRVAKALTPSATAKSLDPALGRIPLVPRGPAMRRIAALLSFSVALAVSQPADDAAAAVEAFRPSADTYVDEAHPNRYFGSGKRLRTRAGSRPAKQVYVRFAVAGLAGSVTGAKLRFRVANGTSNGPAVFLTEEWPSNPLTWERRPAAVGGPATTRAARKRQLGGMGRDPVGDTRRRLQVRAQGRCGAGRGPHVSRTTMQPQLVVTTSDPPSTVVYVEPTQGETVSGVTPVRCGHRPRPTGSLYACGGESVGEDRHERER